MKKFLMFGLIITLAAATVSAQEVSGEKFRRHQTEEGYYNRGFNHHERHEHRRYERHERREQRWAYRHDRFERREHRMHHERYAYRCHHRHDYNNW